MKLKVMSETNSPPSYTGQMKNPNSGQYSKMSKNDKMMESSTRRGSAIHKSSSKGGIKSSLGTGRSNGRGVGTNGTTGSSKNEINSSKPSSKGGGNM